MRILKNLKDLNLSEDQQFFASIIKDEFGCDTYIQDITNAEFIKQYARPQSECVVYNTASPNTEGVRLLAWRRKKQS